MSRNCRIEVVDGELTCLCPHRNYDNCDLVKAEKWRDEQIAKENGVTLEEYYGAKKNIRDKKTKKLFIKYLEEHPDERFMQAVRNFICVPSLVASGEPPEEGDTFYWECDEMLWRKEE